MRRFRLAGVIAALALSTMVMITLPREARSSRISYRGKSLSFWCDHLPCSDPYGGYSGPAGGFATTSLPAATVAERIKLNELEMQSMTAINVLGTNCMPELLKRLRERPSEVRIKLAQFLIKLGVMKPDRLAFWDRRRMQAFTGIIQLSDPCLEPELTIMLHDRDPWIRMAATSGLHQQRLRLGDRIARDAMREVARLNGEIAK